MTRYAGALAALALALVLVPLAAEAKIVCKEGFQIVSGSPIATPYCQDNYVAQVARTYGMKVSEAEVRNNPSKKREVCRFVGRDIRIAQACIDYTSPGRRGF